MVAQIVSCIPMSTLSYFNITKKSNPFAFKRKDILTCTRLSFINVSNNFAHLVPVIVIEWLPSGLTRRLFDARFKDDRYAILLNYGGTTSYYTCSSGRRNVTQLRKPAPIGTIFIVILIGSRRHRYQYALLTLDCNGDRTVTDCVRKHFGFIPVKFRVQSLFSCGFIVKFSQWYITGEYFVV